MVKIQLFPQGTRVRVRRGDYPLDPSVKGRAGTVLLLHRTRGTRYGVQLDGEDGIRAFDESELELLEARTSIEEAGAHRGGGGSDAPS
jgi:hypothetical protein